jgi:cyanophycinase
MQLMKLALIGPTVLIALLAGGCASSRDAVAPRETRAPRGTLLAIGGGLEDDNAPVYQRFVQLARDAALVAKTSPRIVIVTTASGDEPDAATGKRESFAVWCPDIAVDTIGRDTPPDAAAALIDRASALFFTGGDQQRITTKYRAGTDSPELLAMHRLLARDGVIAGTSAGAAMLGDIMFLGGRSPAALGIVPAGERAVAFDSTIDPDNPPAGDDVVITGPRIARGMGLLPWAMVDSHFFERDRVGRLVAALETSGTRLGIGVGEDACVEIDLETGDVIGTSVAASLVIDAAFVRRAGLSRRGGLARVMQLGDRVNLQRRLTTKFSTLAPRPPGDAAAVDIAEPGQSRPLASWRVFVRGGTTLSTLDFGSWRVTAWPQADGWTGFDIDVP